MQRVVVAIAVVAVLLVGIWVAWGATHESGPSAAEGPRLVLSPREGDPGDAVAVEGTACPRDEDRDGAIGGWHVEIWLQPAPGTVPTDVDLGEPAAVVTPDERGRWRAELTVPDWRTEYRLEAGCFDEARPPSGFLYRSEVFDAR